jgi:hypothetical protein
MLYTEHGHFVSLEKTNLPFRVQAELPPWRHKQKWHRRVGVVQTYFEISTGMRLFFSFMRARTARQRP